MLSFVVAGFMLAVSPPALPEDPATMDVSVKGPVEGPVEAPEPTADAIVIEASPATLPIPEQEVGSSAAVTVAPPQPVVVVDRRIALVPPRPAPKHFIPQPPWSGSGRFVGGSVMLLAGIGLLTAATLEYSSGHDTTQPLVSQVPLGVSMLVASGFMIGTAARDQRRLSEWEAATRVNARPSGNGLIIGGVTAVLLGGMSALATSIASDMDLDAPRSIPAGWATAGIGLGAGTALLVAGIVRRVRYGEWRDSLRGVPMVAPSRAGATVGFVGQF